MRRATDTKDERESRRRHECDGVKRSHDQDATALGCCEELADSAAKIVPPMRTVAYDGDRAFRKTHDGDHDGDRAFRKMTTNYLSCLENLMRLLTPSAF